MTSRTLFTFASALALASTVAVQAAAPAVQAPPAPAGTAPAAPGAATAPAAISYNPDGRRDPFVSLIARGTDNRPAPARRTDGLGGLEVNELTVRGLMQSRGGYVAIVQGADNKTFIARANDRLQDGTIKAITAQGLVILQEVSDPLSLVKQREVHKGLRAADEGK